jgi:carboxymethylenebutenolidase
MIVFGSRDPHVPAEARVQIVSALYATNLDDPRTARVHRWRTCAHAGRRARYDPVLTDPAWAEAVSFLTTR